jgi:hypothetical protein
VTHASDKIEKVEQEIDQLFSDHGVKHVAHFSGGDTYQVRSSKGFTFYRVIFRFNPTWENPFYWRCSCPAYQYGGGAACKHITLVQELNERVSSAGGDS